MLKGRGLGAPIVFGAPGLWRPSLSHLTNFSVYKGYLPVVVCSSVMCWLFVAFFFQFVNAATSSFGRAFMWRFPDALIAIVGLKMVFSNAVCRPNHF